MNALNVSLFFYFHKVNFIHFIVNLIITTFNLVVVGNVWLEKLKKSIFHLFKWLIN